VTKAKVILIGGAPGAGKTTLGRNLAIKAGVTSLTIDDLMIATRAVTTKETHPGLHIMSTGDPVGYFTENNSEQLIADAKVQHEATWPAVEKVIRSHAADWGSPIVIDGWAIHPSWVAQLGLNNVTSYWLHVKREVLEQRERKNTDFFGQSSDPERMFQNFLGRSYWYNDLVREEADSFGLPILEQDGTVTVEELCAKVLGEVG
jgi:2-phosphoglycerate kinase